MSKDEFFKQRQRDYEELFGLSMQDGNRLEWLLMNAAIPAERERIIWNELYNGVLDDERGKEIIEYLEANQRDPIAGGFNYQQRDIKWKLKNNR